jgi:hypothetical protein
MASGTGYDHCCRSSSSRGPPVLSPLPSDIAQRAAAVLHTPVHDTSGAVDGASGNIDSKAPPLNQDLQPFGISQAAAGAQHGEESTLEQRLHAALMVSF